MYVRGTLHGPRDGAARGRHRGGRGRLHGVVADPTRARDCDEPRDLRSLRLRAHARCDRAVLGRQPPRSARSRPGGGRARCPGTRRLARARRAGGGRCRLRVRAAPGVDRVVLGLRREWSARRWRHDRSRSPPARARRHRSDRPRGTRSTASARSRCRGSRAPRRSATARSIRARCSAMAGSAAGATTRRASSVTRRSPIAPSPPACAGRPTPTPRAR